MEEKYVSVLEALIEDDHIIMADVDDWIMIDFDIIKNQICSIYPLTNFEADKLFFCEKIIHIGQSYYFLYRNCMRIKELDTKTMTIYNYGTDDEIGINNYVKYRGAFVRGDEIIMLPGGLDEVIWSFDVNRKVFHSYGTAKDLLNLDENIAENQEIRFFCVFEGKYWFGFQKTKWIGYITLSGALEARIMAAPLEGDFDVVLSPRYFIDSKAVIFKDDRENLYRYENEEVSPFYLNQKKVAGKIRNVIPYHDQWIVMTDFFDGLYIFSSQGEFLRKIPFPIEFKGMPENRSSNMALIYPIVKGKDCYLLPFSANGFIRFNMETEEIRWIPITFNQKAVALYTKKQEIYAENALDSLQCLLGYIRLSDLFEKVRFSWVYQ